MMFDDNEPIGRHARKEAVLFSAGNLFSAAGRSSAADDAPPPADESWEADEVVEADAVPPLADAAWEADAVPPLADAAVAAIEPLPVAEASLSAFEPLELLEPIEPIEPIEPEQPIEPVQPVEPSRGPKSSGFEASSALASLFGGPSPKRTSEAASPQAPAASQLSFEPEFEPEPELEPEPEFEFEPEYEPELESGLALGFEPQVEPEPEPEPEPVGVPEGAVSPEEFLVRELSFEPDAVSEAAPYDAGDEPTIVLDAAETGPEQEQHGLDFNLDFDMDAPTVVLSDPALDGAAGDVAAGDEPDRLASDAELELLGIDFGVDFQPQDVNPVDGNAVGGFEESAPLDMPTIQFEFATEPQPEPAFEPQPEPEGQFEPTFAPEPQPAPAPVFEPQSVSTPTSEPQPAPAPAPQSAPAPTPAPALTPQPVFTPEPQGDDADAGEGTDADKSGKGLHFLKSLKLSNLTPQTPPTKRSINLIEATKRHVNRRSVAIVAVVAAAAFIAVGKFGIYDPISSMIDAQSRASELRSQVTTAQISVDSMGELSDTYAHYTYSGMTEDELTRTDRMAILDMIERTVMPNAQLSSWSVSGDTLTTSITANSLQDISTIAQLINAEEIVNYCSVTTATNNNGSNSAARGSGEVTANITVYLNPDEAEAML